ncbi:MAG: hypothetical protein QM780_13180 [Hyphomicrobium sp.]|uniref:hypothetical protein n=1 Tax=Hyphomicrobium sp. TaxID=82 RepID=UPI0039E71E31
MGPTAIRLVMACAFLGWQAAAASADDATASVRKSESALPAFVAPSRRGSFATAVNDNSASAAAARNAAEALSAKFSDIATSSISKEESQTPTPAAAPAPAPAQPAEVDPPHVVTQDTEMRSIVLSSRRSNEEKAVKDKTATRRHSTTRSARPRIPRKTASEASGAAPQAELGLSSSLVKIGQKVGFLDLLTNPALWQGSASK